MPLSIPNLDDRTYADLVEEAVAMLPRYAPEWTNHNASDPGITLIELLAYFTEMLIYRLNRVTRENKIEFIKLLGGPECGKALADASMEAVDEALREAVFKLRDPQRAVTAEDFEYLARRATTNDPKVVRACCIARRNLEGDPVSRELDCPGHVSVVIVPGGDTKDFEGLVTRVQRYLEPMRLLTTRLHVVKPYYVSVSLGANIYLRQDFAASEVRTDADDALHKYFNSLPGGGPKGDGWPFGGNVYLSDVYDVLERVAGIDYIEDPRVLALSVGSEPGVEAKAAVGVQIGVCSRVGVDSRLGVEPAAGTDRLIQDSMGKLVGVALRPYELVHIAFRDEHLRLIDAAFSVGAT